MIIKTPQRAQHYRVTAPHANLCHVGDPVYTGHAWDPDPIGFITAIYESAGEIDIMLFESMPAPDTMVHCYAEMCTPEEVEDYLLNPNP